MTLPLQPPVASSSGDGRVRRRTAVRWREDVGWEARCERCVVKKVACYWPLTDEFWDKARMNRCRACERERQASQKRHRYQTDPAFRDRMLEAVRTHRRENESKRADYNRFRWIVIKSDPILLAKEHVRKRVASAAYRARKRAA